MARETLDVGKTVDMASLVQIKNILSSQKERLFKEYHVAGLAVFGSFTRNEQREDSDVDILVEFSAPVGMEFIDLANDLERILNRKVSLVSKNGIKSKYLSVIQSQLSYV